MEPTIAEEVILSQDENCDEKLLGILYRLVEKCSHQLLNKALFPHKAGLIFRYTDHKEVTRRINLPGMSFWDFDLYRSLERVFLKAYQRRLRIRFIKVWFQDFSPPTSQLSLFPAQSFIVKKKALATQALNRIRERYGEETIKYGRAA